MQVAGDLSIPYLPCRESFNLLLDFSNKIILKLELQLPPLPGDLPFHFPGFVALTGSQKFTPTICSVFIAVYLKVSTMYFLPSPFSLKLKLAIDGSN